MATQYPKGGKGRRWTVRELATLPSEWHGDTLRDGDGLIGEVRIIGGAASVRWRFEFWWLGKKARHYCGTWPGDSLEDIRKERDRAKAVRDGGTHPTAHRQASRIEAQAKLEATIAEAERRKAEDRTWREMYEEWIAQGVHRANDNAEITQGFEKHLLPTLGKKPVRTVGDRTLVAPLRAVGIEHNHPRTAEKLASEIRQMYRWAAKRQPWRGLMKDGNPADLLEPKDYLQSDYEPGVRDRVLLPSELVELRDKLTSMEEAYVTAPPGGKYAVARPLKKETQLALWISLGTSCRIGELLKARWANVDLAASTWRVPKADTKTKLDWSVHLSPFALRQFRALHQLTGEGEWCFPARRKGRARAGAAPAQTHVHEKSVTKQVGDRQLQFMTRKKALARRANDNTLVLADGANGEWTPHDMRRTASTMMQELGVLPEIIDRCQNHKMPGDDQARRMQRIRKHYQHYDYAKEKRDAWDRLGQQLDKILHRNRDDAERSFERTGAPVETVGGVLTHDTA